MARQAGMTLIELTVVLLVLIGLAGLLMPYVGGFVEKTHDSTGASNIAAVNSAMLRYQASYQSYPDNLDSLIDDATTTAVYTKLMGPDCLAKQTLTAEQAMAFKMAGIDTIMQMDSASTDATFSATTGVSMPMVGNADTTEVAMLTNLMGCATAATTTMPINSTNLKNIIVRTPNTDMFDYVVFGVGSDNSMIGKALTTAPVHFAQTGNMGPKLKYNRFAVVFEVPKSTVLDNGGYCLGQLDGDSALVATQPITEATCIVDGPVAGGTGTAAPGNWTEAANAKAEYAGAVMLMPMIEGLTGALQRHYDKSAEG